MSVGPEHILEAARVLRAALAPHLHQDWSVPVSYTHLTLPTIYSV